MLTPLLGSVALCFSVALATATLQLQLYFTILIVRPPKKIKTLDQHQHLDQLEPLWECNYGRVYQAVVM